MRPSFFSFAFLGSFVGTIFLYPWKDALDPRVVWILIAGTLVTGVIGIIVRSPYRSQWGMAAAGALGAMLALWRIESTIAPTVPNAIIGPLEDVRMLLEGRIQALFPEPHASLLTGLLLGGGKTMPRDLYDAFRDSGLTHIIAVSGYNITMLVTIVSAALFWLPLKMRLIPSIVIVVAFTLITGASASAVRAAVMGILGLIALHAARPQMARLTMLWAAFFMLLWNPTYLAEDAGFQLSFLALIGLQEISPLLQPKFERLPPLFGIRDMLCLTVSTQLTTSPWILHKFGRLSLIAPLTNLLAPPLVPVAMLFGSAALIAGTIWRPFGLLVAAFGWLPLQWIILVGQTAADLPFANVEWFSFGAPAVIGCYALLLFWVLSAQGCFTTRTDRASAASSPTGSSSFPQVLSPETKTHAK